MNKNKILYSAAVIISLLSTGTMAGEIKVKKVKGNSAVISTKGFEPEVGKSYKIMEDGDEDSSDSSAGSDAPQSRTFGLALQAQFVSLSNSSAEVLGISSRTTVTSISFGAAFLYNLGIFEIGPILNFGTAKISSKIAALNFSESSSATTYGGGLAMHINFISNSGHNSFVPGIAVPFFVQGGNKTDTDYVLTPSLFVKAFVLGKSTSAIIFHAGYSFLFESEASGPVSSIGISTYF